MNKPLKLAYHVEQPGEPAAGIHAFTDNVTVTVESGDAGGEAGEFDDYMRQVLEEWFDGAKVYYP